MLLISIAMSSSSAGHPPTTAGGSAACCHTPVVLPSSRNVLFLQQSLHNERYKKNRPRKRANAADKCVQMREEQHTRAETTMILQQNQCKQHRKVTVHDWGAESSKPQERYMSNFDAL